VENLVTSDSAELSAALKKYTPFISEVRKRILYTLGAFLLATILGFVFYEQIIKFLIDILSLRGVNVVFTSPFQFINLSISCGLATGLVTVFPLIIFQILSFLRPALKRKEFQTVASFIPLSLFLFLTGFAFGILIMRWQIQIFLSRASSLEIGNILDISRILSTVLLTSVIMGLGFQFPIILYLLMKLGVLQPSHLNKWRKWVYLGSFIFAIMLPLDSVIADILLTLPLILLFELTLILYFIFGSKKSTPSKA
jgi:sec-independent protein translocase protein TatC